MPRESTVKGKPMSDGLFPTAVREGRYPPAQTLETRERERGKIRPKILCTKIIIINSHRRISKNGRRDTRLPVFPHQRYTVIMVSFLVWDAVNRRGRLCFFVSTIKEITRRIKSVMAASLE